MNPLAPEGILNCG